MTNKVIVHKVGAKVIIDEFSVEKVDSLDVDIALEFWRESVHGMTEEEAGDLTVKVIRERARRCFE